MPDESHLDDRYFIDASVYNCPFCNRRNVMYYVTCTVTFNWSFSKKCYVYIVQCSSCFRKSMHLTFTQLVKGIEASISRSEFSHKDQTLDDLFFYSVPTSFFVLDERIPRVLRELLTEAEGSLKSNFLTGASACARKMVYELAAKEQATGDNYEDRIKSLKQKRTDVDGSFFDALLAVQKVTSSKVHENAYDGWEAKHVKLILATLRQVLYELYVAPEQRKDRQRDIASLRAEVLG